jgi:DNA-binding MarR family transcriptional regulator
MLQLSQRPLMSTDADAGLFVDRGPALGKLERALRLKLNAIVLGERGSGKTSLLHHLERKMRSEGVLVRFVEASSAGTVEELVDLLHAAARGRPRDPMEKAVSSLVGDHGVAADLKRLGVGAPAEPLVLLVDSILQPRLVHELFGQQRDELWQLPLRWVVAGNSADRSRYLEPPADSFFDVIVELDELSVEDATELLLRRASASDTDEDPAAKVLQGVSADLAQRVTPRTPRQLLSAARATLLDDDDPTTAVQNLHALQQHAAGLGRPAAMLFAELMNMGPMSASDERLLERLGWTRARMVQVLKQLEGEGLVVATTEARGQGRPRKLYELAHHQVAPKGRSR